MPFMWPLDSPQLDVVTLPVTLSPVCVRLATTGTAEQPGTPEWKMPVQVPVTLTAAAAPLPGEVTMLEESLHAEAAIRPAASTPASGSERFEVRRDGMDGSFRVCRRVYARGSATSRRSLGL